MTVNEFIDLSMEKIQTGWVIAALTDEYIVDKWPLQGSALKGKEEKVLEIRIFNQDGEMKLSRSDISRDFAFRTIFDVGVDTDPKDKYDELQYLDIDEKNGKSSDGKVTTTGGGRYNLPIGNLSDAMIRIRYYLGKYEDTGHARVEDWRIVEFVEGK